MQVLTHVKHLQLFSPKATVHFVSSQLGINIPSLDDAMLCLLRTAANALRGPEQLQMLQQSIVSGIFTPSYKLTKNSCKSQNSFMSRGPVQCVCQPECSTVQVQCSSLFLNERTENQFFKMNETICLALMLVLSVKMMLSPRSCK